MKIQDRFPGVSGETKTILPVTPLHPGHFGETRASQWGAEALETRGQAWGMGVRAWGGVGRRKRACESLRLTQVGLLTCQLIRLHISRPHYKSHCRCAGLPWLTAELADRIPLSTSARGGRWVPAPSAAPVSTSGTVGWHSEALDATHTRLGTTRPFSASAGCVGHAGTSCGLRVRVCVCVRD